MGQVIDFQEAKAKILGRTSSEEPKSVSAELSNALEEFSFSRLAKIERITRSLYQAFQNCHRHKGLEGDPTLVPGGTFRFSLEDLAAELVPYLPDDVLTKPIPKAVINA